MFFLLHLNISDLFANETYSSSILKLSLRSLSCIRW